ncbi:MAG: FAD-dependent thymidylate synthase [Oscillospiraceae bacterium]
MSTVTLIAYTPFPEKVVSASAKLCYSDTSATDLMDGLTDEKTKSFLEMLNDIGHQSPIEHAYFTFGIEGVSRTLLAQITRHRIASFSVQSQRYVKKSNFVYITPPAIANDEKTLEIFNKSMQNAFDDYNTLADILESKYFEEFKSQGFTEKVAKSKAEKKAIEDARFVLPNACETKMVVSMNARSLMNFFSLRCCNRAQWEIKNVADKMLKLCYDVAPTLFRNAGPSCLCGTCPEGKMSCGKCNEVRKFYEDLKV